MSQNLKETFIIADYYEGETEEVEAIRVSIIEKRIKELEAEGTIRGVPVAFREIKELNRLLGK